MIVTRLRGGLGNQMFQYAMGRRLSLHHRVPLAIDTSALLDRRQSDQAIVFRDLDLDIFDIRPRQVIPYRIAKILGRVKSERVQKWISDLALRGRDYIRERAFHADEKLIRNPPNRCLLDGYWQSARYFDDIKDVVRRDFAFVGALPEKEAQLHRIIRSANSICLNVRRTDFVGSSFHAELDVAYFIRAAGKIVDQVQEPHFFIFSDDVDWCRQELRLPYSHTFVDHSYKGRKFGTYLHLMTACKHFVIPNSTFAWWAAWLGRDAGKKVIAPTQWLTDGVHAADTFWGGAGRVDTSDVAPSEWERI